MSDSGVSASAVRSERLRRQGLARPLTRRNGFEALFRRLQPVSTGPQVRPGSPPRLTHRTRFDSEATADGLRAQRRILKGRFQGGGIGYVHVDDFALYANAFRKPLEKWTPVQREVFDAIQQGGPLTSALVKEETGLLKKQINPALQRLQEAFLVYEDQVDDDWERGFYDLASEWPEFDLDDERRDADAAEVLARFVDAFVFATREQVCDWSKWPGKRVDALLESLREAGRVEPARVPDLGEGYRLVADGKLSERAEEPTVYLLNRLDFLCRAHASELERRFGRRDILQLLYQGGEFIGAVRGHWGFKPFDVDDVVVELPVRKRAGVREEVLALVAAAYPAPRHGILRYAGKKLSSTGRD